MESPGMKGARPRSAKPASRQQQQQAPQKGQQEKGQQQAQALERPPLSREQLIAFFERHSSATRSADKLKQYRADLQAGRIESPSDAIMDLRDESFRSIGIDPVYGLAQLRLLLLESAQSSTGGQQVGARGAEQGARGGQPSSNSGSTSGAMPNGVSSSQAAPSPGSLSSTAVSPPMTEADIEIIRAVCQMNAEEEMLLDELGLTPLAFAQKKMQNQIVSQQKLQFFNKLRSMTIDQQRQYWDSARERMEKEQTVRQQSVKGGLVPSEGSLMTGREVWDEIARPALDSLRVLGQSQR